MKRRLIPSLTLLSMVMTGCASSPGSARISLNDLLNNPLFAERYAEEVVDRLVELEIINDPIVQDSKRQQYLERERKHWLEVAQNARATQREGTTGQFIPMGEYANGEALYVRDTLYFSSLFEADPGPSVHVFLTTVVDPRDVSFPDETAIDLGPLQTAYGAQEYDVPAAENPLAYRTVVLWDTGLERLHSFVQLNK